MLRARVSSPPYNKDGADEQFRIREQRWQDVGKKLFLTSVAALLLTGAAHAGQRAHAIVGQPRIITRIIQTGLLPPPKYDKPYDGELEIWFFSNPADVQQACNISGGDTGCTKLSDDHKHCWMFLATEDLMKRKGNYAFVLRHELAHCNGWTHPKTTEGRHFDLGETWDKAEGGKWIAADTKMPMPKLPASTRILPASPPTICVTPDWKQEACKDRSKDTWSTARPFWMNTIPDRTAQSTPLTDREKQTLYRMVVEKCVRNTIKKAPMTPQYFSRPHLLLKKFGTIVDAVVTCLLSL